MKRILCFALMSVFLAAIALAADLGKLEKDANGNIVQGAAPREVIALTGVTYTTSTISAWWAVYCATGATVRLLPYSTATPASYNTFVVPATTRIGFVINKALPYVQVFGCTGDMLRQ